MQVRRHLIRVISTGGTFEKTYDPINEILRFDKSSAVPELLRVAGLGDLPHSIVMQKDSLDMEDDDRAKIVEAVEAGTEDGIVVIHGTSKMVESARYVSQLGIQKCIVFVGALVPVRVSSAEGAFNLGGAIVAAKLLDFGVYIAMDGKVLIPATTVKDPKTGMFIGESP